MQLYKTEQWERDFGDCIFFHLDNFKDVPQVICSSPIAQRFEDTANGIPKVYWSHFVKFNFNDILKQAAEQFDEIVRSPEAQAERRKAFEEWKNQEKKNWVFLCQEKFGGSIKRMHFHFVRECRAASCKDNRKHELFKSDVRQLEEIFNLEKADV